MLPASTAYAEPARERSPSHDDDILNWPRGQRHEPYEERREPICAHLSI